MKIFLSGFLVMATGLLVAGCNNLDLTGPGSAERVVEGAVVIYPTDVALPPGTEVIVRVLDMTRGEGRGEVLGEETITNPSAAPIPFHIEYRAEDEVLRRRVTIDARVSTGRALRYYTASAHPITLSNVNDKHMVEVAPAGRNNR